MRTEYDFIIIGAGFGCSVSALRLAEKGYRVLVLEKGKRLSDKHFPRRSWNLKRWIWLPAVRFFGFFQDQLVPAYHGAVRSRRACDVQNSGESRKLRVPVLVTDCPPESSALPLFSLP